MASTVTANWSDLQAHLLQSQLVYVIPIVQSLGAGATPETVMRQLGVTPAGAVVPAGALQIGQGSALPSVGTTATKPPAVVPKAGTCTRPITKGDRKDQPCGKKAVVGTTPPRCTVCKNRDESSAESKGKKKKAEPAATTGFTNFTAAALAEATSAAPAAAESFDLDPVSGNRAFHAGTGFVLSIEGEGDAANYTVIGKLGPGARLEGEEIIGGIVKLNAEDKLRCDKLKIAVGADALEKPTAGPVPLQIPVGIPTIPHAVLPGPVTPALSIPSLPTAVGVIPVAPAAGLPALNLPRSVTALPQLGAVPPLHAGGGIPPLVIPSLNAITASA